MANPHDYWLSDVVTGHDGNHDWVYQRRHNLVYRRRYVIPYNPQTLPQQANRAKLAAAVSSWQAQTEEVQAWYRAEVRRLKLRMLGYNLYIRKKMKE